MDRCRFSTLVRIGVFAAFAAVSGFGQSTINVPADQPTIQNAINAANNGDTILVAPGTYSANLDFLGKAITVTSSGGAQNTILDGDTKGPVVQFVTGETQAAILDGFTITHGFSANGFGGAIEINNAAPTIRNNIITGNTGCTTIGIYALNSSPQLLDNTISNNGQPPTGCSAYGYGAGVYIEYSLAGVQTQVIGNTIINNTMPAGTGGGISLLQAGNALISKNLIKGNSSSHTGGMEIWNYSNETVVDNVIVENYGTSASSYAGGPASALYIFGMPNQPGMYVTNNTLAGGVQDQAILYLDSTFDSVHLVNNIIFGNGSVSPLYCEPVYGSAPPILENNDVYAAAATTGYSGVCPDQTGLNGNLSVDPAFLDLTHSDYHLQATSQLIDAGSNTAADLPDTDMDGNPRIVDGNNDGNPIVDMGAYEFVPQSSGLSISPAWAKFPNQDVGSTSPAIVFTLTNTSTQVVGLAGIGVNGPFAQTNYCPQSLMPSGNCAIAVTFSPTTGGRVAGSLNIATSSGGVSAALVGVGNFAAATLSPSNLDFGIVAIGATSNMQNLTLSNTGNIPITVNSINISAPFSVNESACAPSYSAISPGTVLPVGASCSILIQFSPTNATTYSGMVSISTTAPNTLSTSLTGTGGVPVANISPPNLSFSPQVIGTVSAAQTVTLANTGNAALAISQISINTPFYQSNNCGGSVSAGASCTITITFQPTSRGAWSGALLISHNAAGGSSGVNLSGTGIGPVVTVNPTSLTFTNQLVGTSSSPQSFTVSSTGETAVSVQSITLSGPFSQTNNCSASLAPGSSCSVQVVFSPTTKGVVVAGAVVNVPWPATPAIVNLSGTSIAPVVSVSPSALNFATQAVGTTSAAQAMTLTNVGNAILTVSSVSVLGDFAQTNNCSAPMEPGASCSIQVTFTPTAPGARSGTLSISSDSAVPIPALPITGTGSDQTTINVPADQPTIQAAINAAADGATVLVAPGTYVENINFSGKAITLRSSGGAASTIIDGNAAGTVVTFNQGETSSAVLNGFTIRNGASQNYGGGIEISGASPNITNNIITGNGGISGIAIDVEGGSPLIQGNTITNNVQNMGSGGGGAIYITAPAGGNSNVSVIGNTITDNHLDAGATGGGISMNYYASALIENNYIARNSAYNGGGGIGASSNASVIIVGNVITNNSSGGGGDGGGFLNLGSGSVLFLNNTLYGDSSGVPGGTSEIAIGGFRTNSTFKNNIVYATSGNSVSCPNSAAVVTATNNIVYFVAPATNVNYCRFFSQSNGNILAEPGMVSPANGDFHLHDGSPAIDAGLSDPNLPATDIGGTTRVLDGNNDGIAVVDIGAYEFVPGAAPAGWAVLAPLGATFPNTVIGGTSPSIAFTLLNNGSAPLTVNSISVNSPFAQTNNCSAVLPAKLTCVIQVTFAPPGSGTFSGTLSVANDGASGMVTAPLSGFGGTISGTLSPVSLDFGHVALGTSSNVQQVTVTSTGTINLPIRPTTVTGPFSYVSGTCLHAVSLAPRASCTIGLTFNPTSSGTASGTLSIISNNPPTTPTVVTLSGVGDPVISVSPASLSFSQRIGTTSAAQMITITNTSTSGSPLTITNISASSPFAQTNNCPASLGAAASCTISVTFSPAVEGTLSSSVVVQYNGGSTSIPISGTGVQPIAFLSPNSLSFGQVVVGSTLAKTASLTNSGDAVLNISAINVSGPDFQLQSTSCGATLAPSASCTINISYTPSARGSSSGSLTVTHDASGSPSTTPLSGTGIAPVVAVSPATLNFGSVNVGSLTNQTVTVSNIGDAPLTFSSITTAAPFSQSSNCGTSLAANASCTITVTFGPMGSGSASGTLVINHNAAGSPSTISLSGTGIVAVAVSASSVAFGAQLVGTVSSAQTITVSNTSDATVPIQAIAIDSGSVPFNEINNCGTSLAAHTTCAINVTFAPNSQGPATSNLTVYLAPAPNQSVALSGTGVAPVATISATSLPFGSQLVTTTSAAQSVTLANTGTAPVAISAIQTFVPFAQTNDCGSSLAPGGSCTINVTFAPTSRGAISRPLTISVAAPAINQAITLSGTGIGPASSLSTSSLTFALERIGTTSPSQAVMLSNTGETALTISSIAAYGATAFAQTNNCPATLSAGNSCSINVTFAPIQTGTFYGNVTITDDSGGASGSTQEVFLTGTGGASAAAISPGSLTFGSTNLGTSSTPSAVTITNSGTMALNFSSISASGDFSQSNNCGTSLLPGSSCAVNVVFTPTMTGSRSGTLAISGDFPGSPSSVSLNGTGVVPGAAFSGTSLSFASQRVGTSSGAQNVILKNTGTGTLLISGFTVTGDFSQSNNCGGSLAPSANCTVSIVFTPTARGTRTATLTLSSNAPANPSVSLTGTGIAPIATFSPTSIAFNSERVNTTSGSQSAHLTNTGDATLDISSLSASAGFTQHNNCPATLAAGAHCDINVTFAPTAAGNISGVLTVSGDELGGPQSVSLSGIGVDYSLSASPSSTDITAGASASYTVTVAAVSGNFNNNVSLQCSGLPAQASCSFSPSSVNPNSTSGSSIMKITTQSGTNRTPSGNYTITVTGTSGSTAHSTAVSLAVN